MAAAAPAAAALDLQPPHVVGCGLAELSMSQLDALEVGGSDAAGVRFLAGQRRWFSFVHHCACEAC
jgi:hypothetical protein